MEPYSLNAQYYDTIYLPKADKMYRNSLRDIFLFSRELLGREPKSVLDIGCGNGNHAMHLADKGIKVTGIDLSTQHINMARKKVIGDNPSFVQADMSLFTDLGATFFGSFCYFLDEERVISFFINCEQWIDKNGFLFLEIWNTLGIHHGSKHFFEVEEGDVQLLRYNESLLDVNTDVVAIPMRHKIIDQDELGGDFTEVHHLKTYTIPLSKI